VDAPKTLAITTLIGEKCLKKHLENGILRLNKNQYKTTKESAFSKLIPLYYYYREIGSKSTLFFGINEIRGEGYVIKINCAKESAYFPAGTVGGKSGKRPTCGAIFSVLSRNTGFNSIQEHWIGNAAV